MWKFFSEIIDSFFFFKAILSMSLMHLIDLIIVCKFCIVFSIWIAVFLHFISLLFLMQSVFCSSSICLSYYFQALIYFNILNIVIFWFSVFSVFSICTHMKSSDQSFKLNILIIFWKSFFSVCKILEWIFLETLSQYLQNWWIIWITSRIMFFNEVISTEIKLNVLKNKKIFVNDINVFL